MLTFPTGHQPSVLSPQQHFSMVPRADIQRSQFDRSHGHTTAFNSGYLIPIMVDEALPGDTLRLKISAFCRLSTPIVPFMDNVKISFFCFATPYRLVWSNFKKFCGEQATTGASTSYTMPVFTAYNPVAESLSDYMNVPPLGGGATVSHTSLPWRCYNLIWNEHFRDQNLQDSVTVDTGDGPDTLSNYVLLRRGKRHDYFTSCLPWTQKNNTGVAVSLPLSGTAAVTGISKRTQTADNTNQAGYESTGLASNYPFAQNIGTSGNAHFDVKMTAATSAYPAIFADLSTATATTINALRLAFQTQKMYERDARGGTRYREIVASHFNVIDPADSRFQVPEYLGGGTIPIMITPVPQTSITSGSSATGRLSATGHAMTANDIGFTKSFAEHCYIMVLACVWADLRYQQGLPRMYSRSTRLDMYWPALANIGEQAVLNKEIYLQGSANPTQDAATFGYQERWAEYRYKPSQISGKMRSTYATPLDYWHLAQKFTSLPTLGNTFIQENPPIDRVVAVNTEPQLFADFWFDYKCARPMPTYSVPGLIDHF